MVSAYDNDPRVTAHACGCHYDVAGVGVTPGMVWLRTDGSFGGSSAASRDADEGFPTADEAIRSLIGDPQ